MIESPEPPLIRHKPGEPPPRCRKLSRYFPDLLLLRERLKSEQETTLLQKIAICQTPLVLKCQTCGSRKEVLQACKRKWCPCCAAQIAAKRSTELNFIVERMRSPLFVTLTMRNSDDLSLRGVRELKRAFGKFRHRNLWKSKVRGGIAAVEITNIGNGWHPHLHAVVDCRWLSNGTPAIHWRDQPARCAEKCRLSAEEVQKVWSKCIGQETSSVDIMRANRATISKEVLKYTIKNEDLVMCEGKIGDVIRALDGSRLLTTFGQCHGQCVKEIRREAKEQAKAAREKATPSDPSADCCPSPEFWPDAGFSLSYFEKTRDPATRTYTKMPRCESLPLTA